MTEHTDTLSRTLHPIERTLLLYLSKKRGEWVSLEPLVQESGLSIDQIRRAIEWLRAKNLIEVKEEEAISYTLGPEGKNAAVQGLPERKLFLLLESSGGKAVLDDISKRLGSEFSVALGRGRRNGWIKVSGREISIDASHSAEREPEEILIEKLNKKGRLPTSDLSPEDLQTLSLLSTRHKGLVSQEIEKQIKLKANDQGLEASQFVQGDQIDEITPEVIRNSASQTKSLRAIDVTSPAPHFFGGRKHPIRLFIDEVKEVFVSLGFEEIGGPMVQSALWNFDALFIPQLHSTREMQDTFYLAGLKADLSGYREEIASIKASHESGGGTGSLGWRYKWSEEEARRIVMRTHTTAVTIKYLSERKPTEARVFSVGRVFRNEKPNYKNNPQFYQIEGVTVGPRLNVRNLIYIISKFYSKLGFEKIKFWPTYFPYTEPSLQTMAYYEKKQRWIELGGMGVFRPEVTIPLGVKNPVLAWGLGLDRLVMMRYDLNDIRDLFGANLAWLRNATVV